MIRPMTREPGHPVRMPDGARAWLAEDGVVIVEDLDAGVYRVRVPDLAEPVLIPAEEMTRAANGVANLVSARVHDARRAVPVEDDPVQERLAAMLAGTLRWLAPVEVR